MKINKQRIFVFILLISVLLRVAVALYYGNVVEAPPLLTDQRSYHHLAVRLNEGHGFTFEKNWYPFTPADTPTSHWSFLYSLFVAAVYAIFGVHPLAARLVQAILGGILLPWMVYRLTRTLFTKWGRENGECEMGKGEGGRGGGRAHSPSRAQPLLSSSSLPLIAAACAAVYGYFILYAATLMTETFYIIALLWSLELGLRIGRMLRQGTHIPISLAVQLGISLGIATLIRQAILPWVPVFFLWLLWQGVETFQRSNVGTLERWNVGTLFPLIIAGLVLLAFILPWTYRNYRVYGEFLLLNSNTGYAMYSAQHPMHGRRFQEFAAAPLPQDLAGNEAQIDSVLMKQGIQFVLNDPGRYLLLSLSRIRAFFEFWPTPDSTLLHNLGRTGSFGVFLPLMLYGLYLAIKRRTEGAGMLYLFMAFYSTLHILTWAMVRYRLPVDAVALPFAALALHDLYQRARKYIPTFQRPNV